MTKSFKDLPLHTRVYNWFANIIGINTIVRITAEIFAKQILLSVETRKAIEELTRRVDVLETHLVDSEISKLESELNDAINDWHIAEVKSISKPKKSKKINKSKKK